MLWRQKINSVIDIVDSINIFLSQFKEKKDPAIKNLEKGFFEKRKGKCMFYSES